MRNQISIDLDQAARLSQTPRRRCEIKCSKAIPLPHPQVWNQTYIRRAGSKLQMSLINDAQVLQDQLGVPQEGGAADQVPNKNGQDS